MPACLSRCLAPAVACLLTVLPAQPPPLAPTSDVTIPTSGPLHYSTILIPAGVTVTFVGSAPAIVRCDGDCIVHGTLSAAAVGATGGPGAVTVGIGGPGTYCASVCTAFGCFCFGQFTTPGSGVHHGVYGAALPFDLEGGSPGGSTTYYDHSNYFAFLCCDVYLGTFAGGGGGGTLVVLAGGRIEVDGTVDIRGARSMFSNTLGSAGAVLLRGGRGVQILAAGRVLAGGAAPSGGYVRLDTWGATPVAQGVIDAPPPLLLDLPHLRAPAPPRIGTTWALEVFAPEHTLTILAASTSPGVSRPTLFGTLAIDPATAATVATATAPPGSHDPRATIPWPIPNSPPLIGLQVWLQGLAVPPSLPARLTNPITATVQ